MSTATMRLRRAGAGGLAAAVIAGMLVATAGSALAWSGGTITVTGGTTALPQGATTAASSIVATLPTAWNVGDSLTFQIANAGNCSTATNEAHWTAATPKLTWPTSYTPVTGDVLPTVTPALTESTTCTALGGTQTDTLKLTFNNSGTNATGGTPILTIANTIAVGTTVPTGPLSVSIVAAGTGAVTVPASVQVGTVVNTSISATPVAAKPSVAITSPAVAVKEAKAGVLAGAVTFTYTNAAVDTTSVTGTTATAKATWSGGGTLSLAATATSVTVSGLVATTSAAGTLSLTGVKITPAALAGPGKIVTVVATGGGISSALTATLAADVNTKNTGGSDRYFTARALYDAFISGGGSASSVVLASGANFPDALSANTLASALGVGVLLTDPTSLSTAASLEIASRKISTVYIIGGTGAVSAKVAAQVSALSWVSGTTTVNPTVVRLGGADRYATNNLVDIFAKSAGTVTTTAFVATGSAFADALAIGPQVISTHNPLILTPSASLGASAQASLIDLGITNVVIVGGTGAVSAATETAITNLGITVSYRLAGADRTQTAQQIATWATLGVPATTAYPTPPAALTYSKQIVHVANGANFPDALAAAQYAGQQQQVILLSNSPTSAGVGGPAFVMALADQTVPALVGTVNGLGLSGAVSQSVLNAFALGILG